MRKLLGISLLELTVGSALMGLLFMSGLQLLSSLFLAQARFSPSQQAFNVEPLFLKTQLQQMLQEAELTDVAGDGLSLHFQNQTGRHQLRFQKVSQSWYLWQDQVQLAHWSVASIQKKPYFQLSTARLLDVQLPMEKTVVSIWLRNL
jgi:hypothetical protein